MIQLAVIITSILCIVIGAYAIILLQQLRKSFDLEFLNSFFYFQILTFIFGLYGILGSLLIRQILPKFDITIAGIETISHFFPLLGLPFLIAAWFLLLKMTSEICNKKTSQLIAVLFFFLTTTAFLAFGLYILKLADTKLISFMSIRKNIFLGFGLIELLIEGYMVTYLFINSIIFKKEKNRKFLMQFAALLGGVSIFKAVSLYYSDLHFTIGLYFLLVYFAGSIPLIFLTRKYIENKPLGSYKKSNVTKSLFDKYSITPREKEIINEICKGKTNKEISETLFITLQTVKDHTHNIFQKTEVRNRVQLSQLFSANKTN